MARLSISRVRQRFAEQGRTFSYTMRSIRQQLRWASSSVRKYLTISRSASASSDTTSDVHANGGGNNKEGDGQAQIFDEQYTAIWGTTLKIHPDAFIQLALAQRKNFWPTQDAGLTATYLSMAEGSNNRVHFIEYSDGKKVCIRVPACGHAKAWMQNDAAAVRNQAHLLRYIKQKTGLLVPEVLAYDVSFKNQIEAPYIMMGVIGGKPVDDLWHDGTHELPLEELRQRILKSLAAEMAKLRHLEFDQAGTLEFQDDGKGEPVVGDSWDLNAGERREGVVEKEHLFSAYSNSQQYFRQRLIQSAELEIDESQAAEIRGVHVLYGLLLKYFPHAAVCDEDGKETFVVKPPDFDAQNVFADDEGNITGLIDWDRMDTVPRYIGWSSMPFWLTADWLPDYVWPSSDNTLRPDELDKYRQDYARYIFEASDGHKDAAFTAKSHLFECVDSTVGVPDEMKEFMEKLLWSILPRVNTNAFFTALAAFGWSPGQKEWIAQQFEELLAAGKLPGVTESVYEDAASA